MGAPGHQNASEAAAWEAWIKHRLEVKYPAPTIQIEYEKLEYTEENSAAVQKRAKLKSETMTPEEKEKAKAARLKRQAENRSKKIQAMAIADEKSKKGSQSKPRALTPPKRSTITAYAKRKELPAKKQPPKK